MHFNMVFQNAGMHPCRSEGAPAQFPMIQQLLTRATVVILAKIGILVMIIAILLIVEINGTKKSCPTTVI